MKLESFEKLKINPHWGFENVRSVEQWTHGYHRYPAKFLPNLVQKLIEKYTAKEDLVADFFAGCGTTLVEAKVHGRKSIGVDINPVAELITKVKTNPILPQKVNNEFENINKQILNYDKTQNIKLAVHERIDYWFTPSNKHKIAFLYKLLLKIKDEKLRNFFLVSLSHILKNSSRWLQSSTKPQIDPTKKEQDPFQIFIRHSKKMIKRNEIFYEELQNKKLLNTPCKIKLKDARKTSIKSNTVGAIITSPPYVTSYEYADIHQLTGYWYEFISDIIDFRKDFIGTFYSLNQNLKCKSVLGQQIVDELIKKDERTAKEVANYFNDMHAVAKEMFRVLKAEGHVCLVIGNTTYKDVKIKSAEVFWEILIDLGFKKEKIIKRNIPHKLIPTIRDKKTGKFSKLNNKNSKLVYPEEYILIAKKAG